MFLDSETGSQVLIGFKGYSLRDVLNDIKKRDFNKSLAFNHSLRKLSTQAKLGNDCTVAVDVTVLKIVKE